MRGDKNMDKLAISLKPMKYRYEKNGIEHEASVVEFVINGEELSHILGIERDLDNSGCDLDPLMRDGICREFVDILAGNIPPPNQFGTPRVVLYRCHCGCDYCGVISCALSKSGQTITWSGIGYEDDSSLESGPSYTFDLDAYMKEIKRFAAGRVG